MELSMPESNDQSHGLMAEHPTPLPTPPGISKHTTCQSTPSTVAIRAPSPSPSCSSLSSVPTPSLGTPANHLEQPPAKRRKLTFAEKETRRLEREASERKRQEEKIRKEAEKEIKDRQRAEDRAKKEEEKREKDLEKEKRRLAKEEKDKEREEEKRKKEEEKAKKKEEEDKKSKSQLRLGCFFSKPVSKQESHGAPDVQELGAPLSRRNSVTSFKDHDQRSRSTSLLPEHPLSTNSDYHKAFPSFFLHAHTTLADPPVLLQDTHRLNTVDIDTLLAWNNHNNDQPTSFPFGEGNNAKKQCRRATLQVKDIIARLQGTSVEPIDLTQSNLDKSNTPLDLLSQIPMKILKFAEDVRPPYIGTYTPTLAPRVSSKLRRRPHTRGLPEVNYDYDSEAEWEDPGEGEDLDSEGEEEIEEEDDEEMSGFVDDGDSEELARKRKPLLGELEPTCTGLCWQDSSGRVNAFMDLQPYAFTTIDEHHQAPIDPYSTEYWQSTPSKLDKHMTCHGEVSEKSTGAMHPPLRIPLSSISPSNARKLPTPGADPSKENQPLGIPVNGSKAPISKSQKKQVSADVLEDFKNAVMGSDLTKAGLVEVLKKQFPKQSKDAIKDTLGQVAERLGRTESEKRWVLR